MFSIVTYSWSVYGAERATATDMTRTYGNGYGTLETAADLSAWPAIVTMPRGGCSSPPPGDPLKRPPCVTGVLRLLDVDSRWAVRCVCVCVCVSEGIDGDWVVNGRCALQCVNCIDSVLNVSSTVAMHIGVYRACGLQIALTQLDRNNWICSPPCALTASCIWLRLNGPLLVYSDHTWRVRSLGMDYKSLGKNTDGLASTVRGTI